MSLRHHGVWATLILSFVLVAPTVPKVRADVSDPWSVFVRGIDVTSAATPERRGGLVLANLSALAAGLDLIVEQRDGSVLVRDKSGGEWRGESGASTLVGAAGPIIFEGTIDVRAGEVYLPVGVIAAVSGLVVTSDRRLRRVELRRSTVKGWSDFSLKKTANELKTSRPALDATDKTHLPRHLLRLKQPVQTDAFRLNTGLSYIIGRDGAATISGSGSLWGVETSLMAMMTLGRRGFDFQTGYLRLVDPDHGWGVEGGDIPSRIWGSGRGIRVSYQLLKAWRPSLALYFPRQLSGQKRYVVSYSDEHEVSDGVFIGGEIGTDSSGSLGVRSTSDSVAFTGRVLRRRRGDEFLHSVSVMATSRGSRTFRAGGSLQATAIGTPEGRFVSMLGVYLRPLRELSVGITTNASMDAHSWRFLPSLEIRFQYEGFRGLVAYRARIRKSQGPEVTTDHNIFGSLHYRPNRYFDASLESYLVARHDGSFAYDGRILLGVHPHKTLTLEIGAAFPDVTRLSQLRARIVQQLPLGFSVAAEYGVVGSFQSSAASASGAFRITVNKRWGVDTPSRGGADQRKGFGLLRVTREWRGGRAESLSGGDRQQRSLRVRTTSYWALPATFGCRLLACGLHSRWAAQECVGPQTRLSRRLEPARGEVR